jgi:hypothetical protein
LLLFSWLKKETIPPGSAFFRSKKAEEAAVENNGNRSSNWETSHCQ